MKTHIALLRGINVSGQKIIKMAELRASLAKLGYQSIQTYIQSGNILFQAEGKRATTLQSEIKELIKQDFGFDVPIVMTTAEKLKSAVAQNPFADKDLSRVYLTLLEQEPEGEHIDHLKTFNYTPEEYVLEGKVVYLFSPIPYGNAKLSNNLFEKKLKVKATTRNWKTVNKLIDLAQS